MWINLTTYLNGQAKNVVFCACFGHFGGDSRGNVNRRVLIGTKQEISFRKLPIYLIIPMLQTFHRADIYSEQKAVFLPILQSSQKIKELY